MSSIWDLTGSFKKRAGECSGRQSYSLRLLPSGPDLVQRLQLHEFPGKPDYNPNFAFIPTIKKEMTVSNFISNGANPFKCTDVLSNILGFCDLKTLSCADRVCKFFFSIINDNAIWGACFESEGLPRVIADGAYRDDLKHLNIMRRITCVSRRMIDRFLGKMVGNIPPVPEEIIRLLRCLDPFEAGKFIGQNYRLVVVPHSITRTVGARTPFCLDESGNLTTPPDAATIAENKGASLSIPLSLKNLEILSSSPLDGEKYTPVFSCDEVSQQCNSCPDKISVYLMRNRVAEESRNKSYADQKKLVEARGFKVTPLGVRALVHAVTILLSGKCSDDSNPLTYACCPDTARLSDGTIVQMIIGGFSPGTGVRIGRHFTFIHDPLIGVVPGYPAIL